MAQTITAVATLLWPMLLLVVLLMFRKPLARVVRSAEQREWTLEVGGQKLSMKQLNEAQNSMIADLQKQVGLLSQTVATLTGRARPTPPMPGPEDTPIGAVPGPDGAPSPPPPADASPTAHSVLWVDDHPENNALLVEQLQRNGVRVDLARSTEEGLALLGARRYGIVVSDMGRNEGGTEVPDAGMRLLQAERRIEPDLPFVFYCSGRAVRVYAERALAAGATAITDSPVVLSEHLAALRLL